jgi:hypothetical protein
MRTNTITPNERPSIAHPICPHLVTHRVRCPLHVLVAIELAAAEYYHKSLILTLCVPHITESRASGGSPILLGAAWRDASGWGTRQRRKGLGSLAAEHLCVARTVRDRQGSGSSCKTARMRTFRSAASKSSRSSRSSRVTFLVYGQRMSVTIRTGGALARVMGNDATGRTMFERAESAPGAMASGPGMDSSRSCRPRDCAARA